MRRAERRADRRLRRGAALLGVAALASLGLGLALSGGDGGSRSVAADIGPVPRATAWKALPSSILSRSEVGAARVGRFIYVAGGFLADGRTTGAVERYDIRRRSWKRIRNLPVAVNHPGMTAAGGKVYVWGGYTDSSFGPVTGALQRYDPRTRRWRLLPPSPNPRAAGALAAAGERLFAVGGITVDTALPLLEVYDIGEARWRSAPSMDVPREHVAAAFAGGRLYVLGGRSGDNVDAAERYDPRSRVWSALPPLQFRRSGFAAAPVGDKVIAFGGEELTPGGTTIRPVELFDPATRAWSRLPGMRTPRHGLGGVAAGLRIYALEGGAEPSLTTSKRNEVIELPRRLLR